jgi:plasmid stability protein
MVRTQLYLDEALHQRLRDLADRQGRSVSDLVREALARAYGSTAKDDPRHASLEGLVSLWRDRRDLGATAGYVRRLRRDTRRRRPE